MNECAADALRVGYVPGVTVAKWARVWSERFAQDSLELIGVPQAQQETVLREGRADMCFVRLPIDREGLHAIPLYRELPVVVVPKDHPIALYDEVATTDLTDERMQDADDIDTLSATLELVAAVGGAAIMPHSLARLHHRKDLVYRTVTDLPPTDIALAWPIDLDNPSVEDFIGVVRGRTARSTRGRQEGASPDGRSAAPKPSNGTAGDTKPSDRRTGTRAGGVKGGDKRSGGKTNSVRRRRGR